MTVSKNQRQDDFDRSMKSLDDGLLSLCKQTSVIKKKAIVLRMQEQFGKLRDLMLKWLQDKDRTDLRDTFEPNNFYRLVRLAALLEENADMDALCGAKMPPDVRWHQCNEAVKTVRAVLEDYTGKRKEIEAALLKEEERLKAQMARATVMPVPEEKKIKEDSVQTPQQIKQNKSDVEVNLIMSQMEEIDAMMSIVQDPSSMTGLDKIVVVDSPTIEPMVGPPVKAQKTIPPVNNTPVIPTAVSTRDTVVPDTVPENKRKNWQRANSARPVPKAGKAYVEEDTVMDTISDDFRKQIDNVKDLKGLMANVDPPDAGFQPGNWLIWMCARVFWNDPTLDDVNFTNIYLPPPEKEKRIIPKFMDGLAQKNEYVKTLSLSNVNFDAKSAKRWHEVFANNKTVKVLDLSSNPWNAELMMGWVDGISKTTTLEELRINNMNFGNTGHSVGVEKCLADAILKNQSIVKLGLELKDPTWRNKIDRQIMQNKDLARQRRVAAAKAGK
ncbi:unnamed protein product [Amoebophrya sp. A120]|nr:unnamed protein product [Amoebophrya sp. A120]|eukprot:GSA120T00003232001.1